VAFQSSDRRAVATLATTTANIQGRLNDHVE